MKLLCFSVLFSAIGFIFLFQDMLKEPITLYRYSPPTVKRELKP